MCGLTSPVAKPVARSAARPPAFLITHSYVYADPPAPGGDSILTEGGDKITTEAGDPIIVE